MRNDLTIIFYTANFINESFASNIRKRLVKAINGLPLIVVSQKPMKIEMFEGYEGEYKNICVGDIGRNFANIYRQALIGAKEAKTKYVAMVEDDALYSPEHFEYIPTKEKFAYDRSIWGIYTWTKPPVFSWKGRRSFWACSCEKDLFIKAMEERFAKHPYPEKSEFLTKLFGEPGKYESQMGVTVRDWEFYYADKSSIQFSHETSLSFLGLGKRKKLGNIQREELSYWGEAKDILKLYKKQDNQINNNNMKIKTQKEYNEVGNKMGCIIEDEHVEEKLINEGMSPTPRKIKEMNFPDAIKEIIAGKKITKLEWCNKEIYGVLEDEILVLWKEDGKKYQWIISEGDLQGEDWVVID